MNPDAPVHYEGTTSTMTIAAPAPGVVVLTISGHDVGEFGSVPMSRLERHLAEERPVELYIDARDVRGVSVEVSSGWALWLGANRARFAHIRMLVGSPYVKVTAGFVRRFSELERVMRVCTDAAAFDHALAASVAAARG